MTHELPALPYAYNALEPFIDTETMQVHHGKHHQTYVDKLNEALAKHSEIADTPLKELLRNLDAVPEDIRTAVRNHGGGHLNHSLFWTMMCPAAQSGEPQGKLREGLSATFGGPEQFRTAFTEAAAKVFGSGWTWLVKDDSGALSIMLTPLQDNPIMQGKTPVLGLDLWEHAFYLKHQNRRLEYVQAWWKVVNWAEAGRLFEGAS